MTETPSRILLVDDSQLILQMAAQVLRQARFDVRTAATMEQLDEQLTRGPVDLILMDVQMPELFGDDVAMVLRVVRGLDAPIYLFSSLTPEELRARSSEAELDGYICKADGLEAMVDRVEKILRTEGASP